MNKEIKITESIDFNNPSLEREHPMVVEGGEGTQKIWRFENGFGCSVVRFSIADLFGREEKIGSYGINKDLWELGVIKFKEDGCFSIVYDTKITDDVIGSLTEKEVEKYLERVKKLNKLKYIEEKI